MSSLRPFTKIAFNFLKHDSIGHIYSRLIFIKCTTTCSLCYVNKYHTSKWIYLFLNFMTKYLVVGEPPTPPEHLGSPPVISGVLVTRFVALYVCFVDRWLSFCPFVFCLLTTVLSALLWYTDSDYNFWYLQTLLTSKYQLIKSKL